MSKNHDALPVPNPQVYARALGKLQYSCPNCGQDHPFKQISWRRGDLHCAACHTRYQIGLGFTTERAADAYLMGKWDSYTANRINPTGTPYDSAKLYGSIEWACPTCTHAQKSFAGHDGQIQCESCSTIYFTSLLFYRLPKVSRLKLKAPHDSLVRDLHATSTTVQPLSASSADSRSGAPSRSTRNSR